MTDHHISISDRSQKSSSSSQCEAGDELSAASSDTQRSHQSRLYGHETRESVTKNVDGSYFPVRGLRSIKRRAERAKINNIQRDSADESRRSSGDDPKYIQPWVEDSSSYVARCETKTSEPSQKSNQRVGGSTSSEPSHAPSHAKWAVPPQTPPSRIKTSKASNNCSASDRSDPSSSQSSSSKSVAFNPSVSVRQPSRRATGDTSSDSDVEDTCIKPDDNSTPSRAGIFGESPVMNEYGQAMPMSDERLSAEKTRRSPGYLWRPRSFDQGSYASAADDPGDDWNDAGSPEPDFDHSKGIFSGMSDFNTDDWKKFVEQTSESCSAIRDDHSSNPSPRRSRFYQGSRTSSRGDSMLGSQDNLSSTPRPLDASTFGFTDGPQDYRSRQRTPRGSPRSMNYIPDHQFSSNAAESQ